MSIPQSHESIEYLVIGHLSKDRTPEGIRLGGTAAYAALTARALGLQAGIVTAWSEDLPLEALGSIPLVGELTDRSTSFENIQTANGRRQVLYHVAPALDYHHIPEAWRSAGIVHLGPIAQEVEPALARYFPEAFIGVTAQGWLRDWDRNGQVYQAEWPEAPFVLDLVDAVVISEDDLAGDEARIEELAELSQVLVVTKGAAGARVFWGTEEDRFPAPYADEVDDTGAGDIFAAAFFVHLQRTGDPWSAAEFANALAAISVTRRGLDGVPIPGEIHNISMIKA